VLGSSAAKEPNTTSGFEKQTYDKCKDFVQKVARDAIKATGRAGLTIPHTVQQHVSSSSEIKVSEDPRTTQLIEAIKAISKGNNTTDDDASTFQLLEAIKAASAENANVSEELRIFQLVMEAIKSSKQQIPKTAKEIDQQQGWQARIAATTSNLQAASSEQLKMKNTNEKIPAFKEELTIIQQIFGNMPDPTNEAKETKTSRIVLTASNDFQSIEAESKDLDSSFGDGEELSPVSKMQGNENDLKKMKRVKPSILHCTSSKSTHIKSNITQGRNQRHGRKISDDIFDGLGNQNGSMSTSEEEHWTDDNRSGADADANEGITSSASRSRGRLLSRQSRSQRNRSCSPTLVKEHSQSSSGDTPPTDYEDNRLPPRYPSHQSHPSTKYRRRLSDGFEEKRQRSQSPSPSLETSGSSRENDKQKHNSPKKLKTPRRTAPIESYEDADDSILETSEASGNSASEYRERRMATKLKSSTDSPRKNRSRSPRKTKRSPQKIVRSTSSPRRESRRSRTNTEDESELIRNQSSRFDRPAVDTVIRFFSEEETQDSDGPDPRGNTTTSLEDTEGYETVYSQESDVSGERTPNSSESVDSTLSGPTVYGETTSIGYLAKFVWKACGAITGIKA